MLTNLNLKVNDIGPVKEANIDIGKINVIGGLNATGKSTVSKLLYCILKGNVANRQEFAYSLIMPSLRSFVRRYRNRIVHEGKDDLSDDQLFHYFDLLRDLSDEELIEIYEKIKEDIEDDSSHSEHSRHDELRFNSTKRIDRQIEVIEKNDKDLYFSILRRILSSEFYSLKFSGLLNLRGVYNNHPFDYSIDLRNNLLRNSSLRGFFSLTDVIYIDSISVLDVKHSRFNDPRRNERITHLLNNLEDDLESLEFLDEEFNEKIIHVQDKIIELLNGKFQSTRRGFAFVSDDGHETLMGDTSSGMKQIGIIQILLDNRKLKEDSFLIIDEPEVNLHPEWQIKLAEILCILAVDLNIHVYINTHSPLFIEAMSIFSDYYKLKEDSNFYLTKRQGKGFTFEKIASDDMGAVYDNLSRPYDDLDDIKNELLFRQ